jgi:hypothetical protein
MHRRLARSIKIIAVVFALMPPAFSQPMRPCSNADLTGSYGFSFNGTNLEMNVRFIIVGRFDADGKGNFKGTDSESVNGKVARGPFTGTYTLNPDCTGSGTLHFEGANFEAKLDFVLVSDGDEIFLIDIGGGNLESGTAKRQFRKSEITAEWRTLSLICFVMKAGDDCLTAGKFHG